MTETRNLLVYGPERPRGSYLWRGFQFVIEVDDHGEKVRSTTEINKLREALAEKLSKVKVKIDGATMEVVDVFYAEDLDHPHLRGGR